MKWQDGIYRLQSLVEDGQGGQLGRREARHAAGQVVRVRADLGQEGQEGIARALGDLAHEREQGAWVVGAAGVRAPPIQIGLQKGVPAGGIAGVPHIVDGIVQGSKALLLVGPEIVNQRAVRQLTTACQARGERGGNQRPLQPDAGVRRLPLLVRGQPDQVRELLQGGGHVLGHCANLRVGILGDILEEGQLRRLCQCHKLGLEGVLGWWRGQHHVDCARSWRWRDVAREAPRPLSLCGRLSVRGRGPLGAAGLVSMESRGDYMVVLRGGSRAAGGELGDGGRDG